jgi:aromatic-L-amino-acid decarboxylase
MEQLNSSGDIYLTHTKLDGKFTLRLCVGQLNTVERHVTSAWKRIQEEAVIAERTVIAEKKG